MENLLLIDSASIINQAYYANQYHSNDMDGVDLYKHWINHYCQILKADYIAIIEDNHNRKSHNFELSSDYKSNRHVNKGLKKMFPHYNKASKDLATVLSLYGNEADDYIASFIHQNTYLNKNIHTYIISNDRDLLQLVDDEHEISMYLEKSGNILNWNNKTVQQYFGINYPWQVVDYKALAGDGADGYVGIPGIGGKGASNLLLEFNSVYNIYKSFNDKSILNSKIGRRYYNKLDKGYTSCVTSYKLAKLNKDLPINFDDLNSLKLS